MTKAEFDHLYKHRQIAVHMPGTHEAAYLVNYVNQICNTAYVVDYSIVEFPYLFLMSAGRHTGWTGTGSYNDQYTKITFNEFYLAVNGMNDVEDADFNDMMDMI